jgi:hypothetical protein
MPVTKMPTDLKECRAVWQRSLQRVDTAELQVNIESIEIQQQVIALELRMIAGENLGSERSLLRRAELENRMKQLCLVEQRAKLKEAIAGVTKRQ